jgi:alpha-glucosidase
MKSVLLIALAASVACRAAQSELFAVTSPNGNVQFRLVLDHEARLAYSVSLNRKLVIETSPLGMVVDRVNLSEAVIAGKPDRYKTDQTYPWNGVHSTAVDRSNGARLTLKHSRTGVAYTLDSRAYDSGVAFRFVVPGVADKARVPDENTGFTVPAGSTVWYHDFEGHYEGIHTKKRVDEVKEGEWAAPPLTFKLAGDAGYGAITEGALFGYAGLGLQADGRNGFRLRLGHSHPVSYPFRLRYGVEEGKRLSEPAAVTGTITTPWRVIMAGPDLNTLVNSDIPHAVSPPPDPALFPKGIHTNWIKPGRAVWKYLDGGGENTLANMKEWSRMASELGWEYSVLEGFWAKWTPAELKELVDYSKQRGVRIILWKHSRDLRDPAKRQEFWRTCQASGAAGAKIDFFDHEAKEIVDIYETLLREAAQHSLVLNFHGANKPSGESRTFPNELTREAIRGMEGRKNMRAAHDATLPFTRMLAGHADYTPMVFGERRNDTTVAHQIASAAIYTSPMLIYGANPESILKHPAAPLIKAIPSTWDQTIALPASEIGEVAAFARRRDKVWFVAVMNGTAARTLKLPLSFLGTGRYDAQAIGDQLAELIASSHARSENLTIELPPGGGYLVRLTPAGGR